jgi:hypothetical protein
MINQTPKFIIEQNLENKILDRFSKYYRECKNQNCCGFPKFMANKMSHIFCTKECYDEWYNTTVRDKPKDELPISNLEHITPLLVTPEMNSTISVTKNTNEVFKDPLTDTDRLKWNKEYLKKKIGDKKEIRLSFDEIEKDGYTLHLFDRKTYLKNTKIPLLHIGNYGLFWRKVDYVYITHLKNLLWI